MSKSVSVLLLWHFSSALCMYFVQSYTTYCVLIFLSWTSLTIYGEKCKLRGRRFEVFIMVKIHVAVFGFWYRAVCTNILRNMFYPSALKVEAYFNSKTLFLATKIHGVKTHKTPIWVQGPWLFLTVLTDTTSSASKGPLALSISWLPLRS